MVGRIIHITNLEFSCYEQGTFRQFKAWFQRQQSYQLDIETDITDWWNTRKLISIQFGSCTSERVQWFLQWSALSEAEKAEVKAMLEDDTKEKLIHNAAYEYIVLRFHDIVLNNIYDTMLAEKVIMGGLTIDDYALADISWKYLRIIMNKSEQMNFGDDIMTDSKILYGITDVAYLDTIKRFQIEDGASKNLLNVIGLENEAVCAFSDITYNGMLLDKEKWRENLHLAEPIVAAGLEKMNSWLQNNAVYPKAEEMGFISRYDRVTINFGAPAQRTELLKLIFPDIVGGTVPVVKKYIRDNAGTLSFNHLDILQRYMEKDYSALQKLLIETHKDYLVSNGYLVPAGESTINWNSTDQALPIIQQLVPKLRGLAEEERARHIHPVLKDLEKYKQYLKLTGQLGEEFIRKYVAPDGYVRTSFNQLVSTGRVSSKSPNLQNISVQEHVGTRYRNAFIAPDGWTYVSGDYVSQELVILAHLSQEPAWIRALEKGQDLHSVLAEVVYGQKWKDAADADCAYYAMVVNEDGVLEQNCMKCNCKKHKPLRYDVKTVTFLLCYGGTEYKLASELEISLTEAKTLIQLYFSKLPRVSKLLRFLGNFGLENGYTMTLAPFWRRRYFPFWKENRHMLDIHMAEVRYVPALGDIEKASSNHPIQGSSSDITKLSLILIRNWIRENGYWNRIKLVMQLHDSIDTVCELGLEEMWQPKLQELMEQAGKVVVPSGLLKADCLVSPCWTK